MFIKVNMNDVNNVYTQSRRKQKVGKGDYRPHGSREIASI
jgi:hypothetical protein